jgi:hypothetical protein
MAVPVSDEPAPAPRDSDGSYPWEQPAVLPEDRAMGLELKLIELEHERGEAIADDASTGPIELAIDEVRHELEEVAEDLNAAEALAPVVVIDAPEAAEPS